MRKPCQLLLFGLIGMKTIAATVSSATDASIASSSSAMLHAAAPPEPPYPRNLKSSPSPTVYPAFVLSATPTLAPTFNSSSRGTFLFRTLWSFVCPVLSLSIMAWAFNRTTKRKCVCCGNLGDTVPGEITVVNDDHSVVGDASTDVELMPVATLRSRDWTECSADPAADLPVQESYDWTTSDDESIHVTTFFRMK
jgi:hypothetical protein